MYRPEGWVNGWNKEREFVGMCSEAEIFEAGADAMLEGLKKEGVVRICERANKGDTLTFTLPVEVKGMFAKGHLVFIPEEEIVNTDRLKGGGDGNKFKSGR